MLVKKKKLPKNRTMQDKYPNLKNFIAQDFSLFIAQPIYFYLRYLKISQKALLWVIMWKTLLPGVCHPKATHSQPSDLAKHTSATTE